MSKHWIVTKKKNKRELVEAPNPGKFEIPKMPKGEILQGKEKEEALAKFDKWQESQRK